VWRTRLVPSKRSDILEHYESIRPFTRFSTVTDLHTSSIGDPGDRVIGIGGSSKVTLIQDSTTGKWLAVKHISCLSHKTAFIREAEILARLNHPCVLRIVGWASPDSSHDAQIHTEYATNGSLDLVLDKVRKDCLRRFWNPTGIGIIICGIVLGMRYIHCSGVIHRDLKPANILFDEKGYPMISDFGACRLQTEDATPTPESGTIYYSAPELYKEDYIPTPKCDVFSFGLILYEVLVRSPVFSPSEQPLPVLRRLRARDFPAVPAHCGRFMQALIPRCWKGPQDRPSFFEIFSLFRSHRFEIVPNANAGEIEAFCDAILEWERRAGIPFEEIQSHS
jgi:serine/threonine protein kinase